jgi:thioredoxin reductase (NADPH)
MSKPVLLAVDDDPEVLRSVVRDLRRQYVDRYRVLQSGGGAEAMEAMRQLKVRDEPLALLLVDQRMPQVSGVEVLEQAASIFPEAKRVLLTAYADTDAAIRAINGARTDYYLLKPWDPPEERLFPVLDDLLEDWQAGYRPTFTGIRLIADRWSSRAHQLKDFLARNQIPYRFLDVENSAEATDLLGTLSLEARLLPVVVLPDGTHLVQPTQAELAARAGLTIRPARPFYDLAIIGGGPAGLAAAVYGASEGLSTVVIEGQAPGGQAGTTSRIENYLGFPTGLSGGDLARRAVAQARRLGAELITPQQASGLRVQDAYRHIELADGGELACHAVLIATGVTYRMLDAEGVEPLTGLGVFYGAAITEAISFAGEDVFVLGAGNSAGQAAAYLARHARSVEVLVRGDDLREKMSSYLVDQLDQISNVRVRLRTTVQAVHGEGHLEAITLEDRDTGARETVPAAALFIFIGAFPHTEWLNGAVARDESGFIVTGPDPTRKGGRPQGWLPERAPSLLETSIPGVFAAGDVRSGSIKRVASSVGEGAIAVSFVHQYLADR